LKILNLILLFIVLYSTHTFVETMVIEKQIADFKKTANVTVYAIGEEIDYSFLQNDILLNRKSGHPNLIIRDIITFFTGGHSALVIDELGLKTIEVYGYSDQVNVVAVYENNWLKDQVEVIGLRTSQVELEYDLYIGEKYDWFPFLPNNAKYCTELITDTFSEVEMRLDYDFGIATVNDIILSKNTNIFLYKEIENNLVYLYWED